MVAALFGGSCLQGAAPVNAAVRTKDEAVERLAWESRDSWGAAAPDVKHRRVSVHVLHNKTLVLRSDANAGLGEGSHFLNVFVGQSPTKLDGFGTLVIDGGSLSIDGVMEVMRQGNYPGARGELFLQGAAKLVLTGEGETYAGCAEAAGTLSVGGNRGRLKGGEGLMVLRDEATVVLRRLCVGAASAAQGGGRVVLEGSGVRIAGGTEGVRWNATGLVAFKADAQGFGVVNVADGAVRIGAGARLAVDGSGYRGEGGEFALVRAREFSGAEALGLETVDLSSFGGGYSAELKLAEDGRAVVLRVVKK